MGRLLGRMLLGMCIAAAAPASAQQPSLSPATAISTPTVPLRLNPPLGEPTGGGDALPPALAVMPLRLSLMGAAFPLVGAFGANLCASRLDPSGNIHWGFPLQRRTYSTLAAGFVLHGYSSLGCPIDAGIGVGLTYALPLSRTLWLVTSAGVYGMPNALGQPRLLSDARLDLVVHPTPVRAWAIGIGRRGLAVSGLW
jgi:hypothetical protein